MASRIFLGAKTVETHVGNIFAKLDIAMAPDDNRRVSAVLAHLLDHHLHRLFGGADGWQPGSRVAVRSRREAGESASPEGCSPTRRTDGRAGPLRSTQPVPSGLPGARRLPRTIARRE
ncbi:hypothetical protein [Pseudofrankia sp. DC12]|uniref:hypothetical protein n=1 Tax=Pseudofrankia sp. DC12 TaxID=683315 RepID=UPI0005F7AB19|nr:hypothetical protein [Pseudofrankia sp. DC12]